MVHQILEKEFARSVSERYFQGFIVGIGSPGIVRIQRLGDPSTAITEVICVVPGYVPQIGDRVECVWRDDHFAYVAFPLVPSAVAVPILIWNPWGPWPASTQFSLSRPGVIMVEYSATAYTTASGNTLSWPYKIDGVQGNNFPQLIAGNS